MIIEPALVAILPLAGVVLTLIAGLVGAWIQGRREHEKWIREQRYEAFIAVATGIQRWRAIDRHTYDEQGLVIDQSSHERMPDFYEVLIEEAVPLWVLGPSEVDRAAANLRDAFRSRDRDREDSAVRAFLNATRKALKIRG